jgi:pimeloyl-ACP methyl ester carboxylesterase
MSTVEAKQINSVSGSSEPHYEPYGWHHWPQHPYMSYQFRRALGETQEGGGAVGECFLAASRMVPGSKESWHVEWMRVADHNRDRGNVAERGGHIRTAMNCWLRAANYYRHADFWLLPDDPRRLPTFEQCEQMSRNFLRYLNPPGEVVQIPYENGKSLSAYFIRAPYAIAKQPVLISHGGLDSFKDEMWYMVSRGALQRGFSVLVFDGPGQGAALRRDKLKTRHDWEVPVRCCVDYLETRTDVDMTRIALSGSSLGGYYAARAGSFEHRLAACISHGASMDTYERWKDRGEDDGQADQIKWVFGGRTMKEALDNARPFHLRGALEHMKCPYLIIHGGHDVLGKAQVTQVYDYARSHGVDVTLRFVEADETGADHCQHDNPTIGQELMLDWLTEKLGVDETALRAKAGNLLDL